MPTNTLWIDTNNQQEPYLFETTEGSTPSLRVYIYEDGDAISLVADNTAKFVYAVNRESSEIVEVEGTLTAGTNYIDFDFTAAKTAINGKFFSSVIVYNTGDSEAIVQSDGMIILKRNPALDGSTALDTITVINWGLYTSLPPLPWAIGNDLTVFTDCSDSPYYVSVNEAATTFVHNANCDFVFVLPKATTANIGKMYGFMNLKKAYTVTLQVDETDTIDDSGLNGTKTTVRNYSLPSSVMIRQVTADAYYTVWGDGAWITGEAVVDYSSSSSSSSSSSEEYSSSSSSSSFGVSSSSSSSL